MKKIQELQGSSIVKQTTTRMKNQAANGVRASLEVAIAKLKEQGWEELGSGKNAKVFGHDSYPYVLKLFSSLDSCYIKFLKYVENNLDNPHLPRTKGKLLKITDDIFAVRLEKLKKITTTPGPYMDDLDEIFSMFRLQKSTKEIISFYPRYDTLILTLQDILDKTNCKPDLHLGNVMLRGSQIVITDPVV